MENRKVRQFTHGGSAGDTIASLAAVKDSGGGEFYLNVSAHPHWRMPLGKCHSLLTLIGAQPYISKADVCDGVTGHDYDNWRRNWRNGLNLADMHSAFLGVDHTPRNLPWLFVPRVNRVAKVVIHRSPRYHNDAFPWRRLVERYGRDLVFVGDWSEHAEFCWNYGPVSYHHTRTYLELAEVIAGALLFCGNQSSPQWVAQGLRMPIIQETVPRSCWAWNCHWDRTGMQCVDSEHVELPDDLEDYWAETMAAQASGHTLLTTDRLKTLALLARETERLPGEMAELGTWKGGSAKVLGAVCPHKTLHVFDNFMGGLPADDIVGGHKQGEFSADRSEVEAYLAGLRVELHEGVFPQTATEGRFSLVHLDADLYASTLAGLRWFWDRVVPGGVIALDDYGASECPGIKLAVEELGLADRVEVTAPRQAVLRK